MLAENCIIFLASRLSCRLEALDGMQQEGNPS